jgi:2-methylisocitrate lyase-like PEP mutase family enzyme
LARAGENGFFIEMSRIVEQTRQGKRTAELLTEFLVQEKFDNFPREAVEKVNEYVLVIKGSVMVNIAPKTPVLHFKKHEEMDYSITIYPLISLTAAHAAIREKLIGLKKNGITDAGAYGGFLLRSSSTSMGLKKYRGVEEKIMGETGKEKL